MVIAISWMSSSLIVFLLRGTLSATTYFCDAYASWQKGGVENAKGRIRRWVPHGTDLAGRHAEVY